MTCTKSMRMKHVSHSTGMVGRSACCRLTHVSLHADAAAELLQAHYRWVQSRETTL